MGKREGGREKGGRERGRKAGEATVITSPVPRLHSVHASGDEATVITGLVPRHLLPSHFHL